MELLILIEFCGVHAIFVVLITTAVVLRMFNNEKKLSKKVSPTFLREVDETEKKAGCREKVCFLEKDVLGSLSKDNY